MNQQKVFLIVLITCLSFWCTLAQEVVQDIESSLEEEPEPEFADIAQQWEIVRSIDYNCD